MDDQDPSDQNIGKPDAGTPGSDAIQPVDAQVRSETAAQQLAAVEKQMSVFEKSTLRWARTAVIMSAAAAVFVCLQWFVMRDTLSEMKKSGDSATNQIWQAIGNMNWMARIADGSLHQAQGESKLNELRSKTALNATIEQNRLDQRAWVTAVGLTGTPVVDQPFIVQVTARNSGRTFAKHFIMTTQVMIGPRDVKLPPNDPPTQSPISITTLAPDGSYITTTPIAGDGSVFKVPNLTPADIDRFRAGDRRVFIYGRMDYEDIFHRPHWTTYCFDLTTKIVWESCSEHNNVDEDAPPKPN